MADSCTRHHPKNAKIKEAFLKYDTNGDGWITKEELCGVLKSLGSFSNVEINAVFSVIDANGDGRVQFSEFVDWVTANDAKGFRARAALAPSSGDDIELSFANFCEANHDEMDCRSFTKMCKDVGLIDKSLTVVEVDLIFSKVLPKGKRRINLAQFEAALPLLADRKGMAMAELRQRVIDHTRPTFHGTHPGAVHLHDDKSTYTGARRVAEGLPAQTGRKSLADTLPSHNAAQRTGASPHAAAERELHEPRPPGHPSPHSGRNRATVPSASPLPPVTSPCGSRTYKEVFRAFCNGQVDLDAKGFAKLCRDCRLLNEHFVAADADLLFHKVLDKGQRRMHISGFEEALYIIAEKRGTEYGHVLQIVAAAHGPTTHTTAAATPHFHSGPSADRLGAATPRAASKGGPQPSFSGAHPH